MSEEELPKAVWEGEMAFMGIKLKCFVLNDGRRIIDAESMARFLEAMASTEAGAPQESEILEMVKFMRGSDIPHYTMKVTRP